MKHIRIFSLITVVVLLVSMLSGCEFNISFGKDTKETTNVSIGLPSGSGELTDVTDENGNVTAGKDKDVDVPADDDVSEQVENLSDEEIKQNEAFFSVEKITEKETKIEKKRLESNQDDEKIITSNVYTITGRMVKDGVTSQYKLAQNKNKLSIMTSYEGMPIGFIINGLNIYIIDSENKSYIAIPKTIIESADETGELLTLLDGNPVDSEKKVTEEGKEKVDGVELKYKKYDDGTVAYYKGSTIIKTVSNDGTAIYYDEIVNEAPFLLFLPPKGYKPDSLNIENLKKYSKSEDDKND